MKNDPVTLIFELDVDEDWPPVAVEGLLFSKTDIGYRLLVPPFFVRSLSVDDVIKAKVDEQGNVLEWACMEQSGRSTVWIWTSPNCVGIEDALDCLKSRSCNIERLIQFNYYSVDVPPECSIGELDTCLSDISDEEMAVVYPSLRHEDPGTES